MRDVPAASNGSDEPTFAQKLGAEIAGTFILTGVAMSVDILYYTTHEVDYVSRWLARGFAAAVVVFIFSEISGAHANPAVTFGFALRRLLSAKFMLAYWAAQFTGSFAAAGLLATLFGASIRNGASHPGPQFTQLEAAACETILTAVFMLTILATAKDSPTIGKDAALAVGFVVAACGFCAGPISGASMNPARSIAPQLLAEWFQIVWIYAVGPLVGAAIAVLVHWLLCGPPSRAERKAARGE